MIYPYTSTRMNKMKKDWLQNFSEDREQLELSYIAGGNVNGVTSLEDSLAVS